MAGVAEISTIYVVAMLCALSFVCDVCYSLAVEYHPNQISLLSPSNLNTKVMHVCKSSAEVPIMMLNNFMRFCTLCPTGT